MKIKISKTAKQYLNDNEYKYLSLLEFYDEFIKEVESIKKQVKTENKEIFPNTLIPILEKYKIPIRFSDEVQELILWSEIFSADRAIQVLSIRTQLNRSFLYYDKLNPPPTRLHEKRFWDSWYQNNKYHLKNKGITPALPIIQINKKLTKPELIKYIETEWKEINEAMDDCEKSDPFPSQQIQDISLRDLERNMHIYRYRLEGFNYKQIYEKLEKTHKTSFVGGAEEAKRIRFKMHKLLKELGFVK